MGPAESRGWQRGTVQLALALLAACLWALTHRYQDLTGDAELYALQALAKLHPALGTDVYLQDVSQDRYTLFPALYARLIALTGLHEAARLLFAAFTAAFLAAAWLLVRRLAGIPTAWLAVATLLVTEGHYGSFGVFRFSETFLTARTVAEALVVAALACHAGRRPLLGLAVALVAMFVHPLMALPGLLLLVCLQVGLRIALAGAVAGIAGSALLATLALHARHTSGPLALIDGDWLEVVRERSQFLFLQLWRLPDWRGNLLPFASLTLTLLVVAEQRVRALAAAGMLVGAAGLAVAWIAGTVGPIAILIQGQAWRWVWIPSFLGIALLAPTLRQMWADPRCGPACALLLATGWTCAAIDTWAGIGLAGALWLSRPWITPSVARLLRAAAVVLALVLALWTLFNAWTIVSAPPTESGREAPLLAYARNLLGMQTLALALSGALAWWIGTRRTPWIPAASCLLLGTLVVAAVPTALRLAPTNHDFAGYAPWRERIPADASVWVAGARNSAGFVWFTLQRPNYVSVNQSAGVVFSRATAAEIRRRSDVLAPTEDPGWRIMTALGRHGGADKDRPLTAAMLASLCADPQLGFVVAATDLGFGAVPGPVRDDFRGWYLHDCRQVRAAGSAA
jgi:hypothetical protein